MHNYTEVQLKTIAKERGITGYYKLRKVALVHTLEAARLVKQKSNTFNESISNDPTAIFQPTPWRSSDITTKVMQNIKHNIKDIGEWFLSYIPPKPNVVDKMLDSFKNTI